jgi:ABC-type Na+ efflux pump permease subunit
MSKKEKLVWIISGIVALILVIAVVWMFVFNQTSNESQMDSENSTEQAEMENDHNDQVLEAQDNIVYDSDLIGTWLTGVQRTSSDELSYEGFVLRPDGTALAINSDLTYQTWRVEDYRLFFTLENSEVEEISFIIDYIGKDGLVLRIGDTTVSYSLEAK